MAGDVVEKVLDGKNIQQEILNTTNLVNDNNHNNRRLYLNCLSTLFLNVILNRVNEVGEIGEERAQLSREFIMEII